jgi:hypothetical protein
MVPAAQRKMPRRLVRVERRLECLRATENWIRGKRKRVRRRDSEN